MENNLSVSRRGFMRTTGLTGAAALAAACAPQAAPPAAPASGAPPAAQPAAKAAWEADWDKLRAAAKQEGKMNLAFAFALGTSPRKTLETFEKEFGVTVEMSTFNSGSLLHPRVIQEQQAGIFTWDIAIVSGPFGLSLRNDKAAVPLRPQLFRPDVLDDKAWSNGFESGFKDKEKQFGYGHVWEVSSNLWVNTDLVKDDEIKTTQDLLNPKWKGRAMYSDVQFGATYSMATGMRLVHGEDILKKVFVDMEPAYSRDNRQVFEQLIRGQRSIISAAVDPLIPEFQTQGLGRNIRRVYLADVTVTVTANEVWSIKNAPHPNAGRLFVNWLLSKEGHTVYTQDTSTNSRRLDIPATLPDKSPKPGVKYAFNSGPEETEAENTKTVEILKRLVGQ